MNKVFLALVFFAAVAVLYLGIKDVKEHKTHPAKIRSANYTPDFNCFTPNGVKVSFYAESTQFINEKLKAAMGAAVLDDNRKPIVFIDKEKFPIMSKQQQIFLIEHECAHQELGHTEFSPQQFYNAPHRIGEIEGDADCQAIKKLKEKYNFSEVDFSLLFKEYYDVGLLKKLGVLSRPGHNDASDEELLSYGSKRALAMQQCLVNLK